MYYFVDEGFRIFACHTEDYSNYTAEPPCTWLARISDCFEAVLFEQKYEGESIYRRSSFLPCMVDKEEFLREAIQRVKDFVRSSNTQMSCSRFYHAALRRMDNTIYQK